jgi:hypothetical protein
MPDAKAAAAENLKTGAAQPTIPGDAVGDTTTKVAADQAAQPETPLTGSGAPGDVEPLTGSGAPADADEAMGGEAEDEPYVQPEPTLAAGVVQDNVSEPGVQRTLQSDGTESVHTLEDTEQGSGLELDGELVETTADVDDED